MLYANIIAKESVVCMQFWAKMSSDWSDLTRQNHVWPSLHWRVTNGPPFTHVSITHLQRCPTDHLCSDFAAYVTSARRLKDFFTVMLKTVKPFFFFLSESGQDASSTQ